MYVHMKQWWKKTWNQYGQEIVLIVFAVLTVAGIAQYAFGLQYVLSLMPLYLALLTVGALYFWDAEQSRKLVITGVVAGSGYLIELIGTHTGLLFGDYEYGAVMGLRLFGVPLIIGVMWLVVTLSAWQIVQYGGLSIIRRFMLAGVLVVMFDLVLEQFAIVYGLWVWQGNEVPLYNYACWFVFSQLCFWLYQRFSPKSRPSILIAGLLPLMAVFFWLMLVLA